jgi:hypothetical protein
VMSVAIQLWSLSSYTKTLLSILVIKEQELGSIHLYADRLCGLVVRVADYRSAGTTRKKKVVGLEQGSLSLVSKTEELLGRNSSGSRLEIREYGRRESSR